MYYYVDAFIRWLHCVDNYRPEIQFPAQQSAFDGSDEINLNVPVDFFFHELFTLSSLEISFV